MGNVTKSSASDDLRDVNCNVSNKPNTNLLSVNANRRLFTRCVGTSVILKALLFICCYC